MIISVNPMGPAELERHRTMPDAGLGTLRTDRGNLPLDRLDVRASISGLLMRTELTTEFVNSHDTALEATYVFPLPDRAAVTGMTMTAADRTVTAELRERGAAREQYDQAIAAGQRASIAEEERPDVFTMRVGNILPGERVTVRLRLVGPLPYEDGAATFRFPLVVAPRYIPGHPLPGPYTGDGQQADTGDVPDASRVSPPVLLPGFPNPLRLSLAVDIDAAGLELGEVRSSLHTVTDHGGTLRIDPGERADRDFVLRLAYSAGGESAVAVPDEEGDQGTYQLVVLPPEAGTAPRPKDVVLLLDRSGSMGGWKMVAARRAAARVVDTLTVGDRFAVLTFDHEVDQPADLGPGLAEATDRHRYRAVEHLARAQARGGTELFKPLTAALAMLSDSPGRDRVLVLVTDGQVGNEDQIVKQVAPLIGTIRVHTIGIDRAVNAGFLGRLAALGAGRAELVESEDRLDEAMEQIHRRIGAPVVTGLTVTGDGFTPVDGTRSPARLPGLYPGVPLVITGRFTGAVEGALTVTGRTRDDQEFRTAVPVQSSAEPAVTSVWARARLRDLEDAFAAGDHSLEAEILGTSLRFGVLCRFTSYIAVDERVVNEGGHHRRVTQPVEMPSGWESPAPAAPMPQYFAAASSPFPDQVAPAAPGAMPPLPPPVAPAPARPAFAQQRAQGPYGGAPGSAVPTSGAPVGGAAPRSGTPSGGAAPAGAPPFAAPKVTGGATAEEAADSMELAQPARAFARLRRPSGPPAAAGPGGRARSPRSTQSTGMSVDEIRELAAVEVARLREAAQQPALDRRDLLDDLASRLAVLIEPLTDAELTPVRDLIGVLRGDSSLEDRWAAALRVLEAFAAGKPEKKRPFWKA
ncbi:inter-alpha-trypsin inhibitor domain-containing protein [Actinoplanes capillaceus]|uniref:Inter-alpha-trypsin inhibitor domain-containing protein n=1 Tax=Actinoplanes campanulatus TaxID=113559 RepID=A0ABQ3WCR3_9ACTN|nr:VIT domain-containing protein [Actinoplanes capillaceus]GID43716.1 inter-alpha-trypsin inhibitor domain-containing protein [Actinoplanes capillaceus]